MSVTFRYIRGTAVARAARLSGTAVTASVVVAPCRPTSTGWSLVPINRGWFCSGTLRASLAARPARTGSDS